MILATATLALAFAADLLQFENSDFVKHLELVRTAEDPAYHGDVFVLYTSKRTDDPVAAAFRVSVLVFRNGHSPSWTVYLTRDVLDDPKHRDAARRALAEALEVCPDFPVRNRLKAALGGSGAAFEAASVVDGRHDRWQRTEDQRKMGLENTDRALPNTVGGPTWTPTTRYLALDCSGG